MSKYWVIIIISITSRLCTSATPFSKSCKLQNTCHQDHIPAAAGMFSAFDCSLLFPLHKSDQCNPFAYVRDITRHATTEPENHSKHSMALSTITRVTSILAAYHDTVTQPTNDGLTLTSNTLTLHQHHHVFNLQLKNRTFSLEPETGQGIRQTWQHLATQVKCTSQATNGPSI